MPSAKKVSWAELRVGVTAAVAVVLVADSLPLSIGPVVTDVLGIEAAACAAALTVEVHVYRSLQDVRASLRLKP